MKENARQGFWNGTRQPLGYCVANAELCGAKMKRKPAINLVDAETVRLILRLALMGKDNSGPMGVKAIVFHLEDRGIRTRGGGRWRSAGCSSTLARETCKGEHHFNSRVFKAAEAKDTQIRASNRCDIQSPHENQTAGGAAGASCNEVGQFISKNRHLER
jgi:hypothetical protein